MDILDKEKLKTKIQRNVKRLVDKGATTSHALSVIASQNNMTVDTLLNIISVKRKNNNIGPKDVKTSEGSFIYLKSNPNDVYEVIKNHNKEEIIARALLSNKTIKAREEEIVPIITENDMKQNLKEANYNLSIDGLETIDADKLSQILSLANEAETSSGDDETFDTESSYEQTSIEVSGSDIGDEFDGSIADDEYGYEDYTQYLEGEPIHEDVLLDPQSDDETYNAKRKLIHDDEELNEDDMGDIDISDNIYNDISESEEIIDGEEIVENYDEEIAECLRVAGVELNEVSDEDATKGKKDLPQVVGHKTAFSKSKQNEFAPGENQRADYKCVRTKDVMGKESSEGFKEPMNVAKVCCNEAKIKSICETATRMYAKKEHSDWLALDRRYVEKLINEGVGYENASKMLLKAKKGK